MLAPLVLLFLGSVDFEDVSGVKVSCLENLRGKAGRARIEIVVGSGALHESEDARGVAHLLEHLLMRPLGFDHTNGATGWDYTTYFRDVRGAELSTAAVDLAGALLGVPLGGGVFELEREVVLREMETRGSREQLIDPIFGGTILARDAGGTEESVRALKKEDVLAFHEEHYVKGNIAVVARGAVNCADFKATIAPVLDKLRPGLPVPLVQVKEPERGTRVLAGESAFVQGFYWFDSTPAEEMTMRLVAKHLEQRALEELRKQQGLTYSPVAEVVRLGAGGTMRLTVTTRGRESLIATWYEDQVRALLVSKTPLASMEKAVPVVADLLDSDSVRNGLAAIRGEPPPDRVLAELDDANLPPILNKMLAPSRSFGTATPAKNTGSIIVLVVFALLVTGVLVIAGKKIISGR